MVPIRSAGSRSGVNWIRAKCRSSTCPRVFTARVLARPGTPSTRRCPRHSRATIMRSMRAFCPTMTFFTSSIAACTCSDSSRTVSFNLLTSISLITLLPGDPQTRRTRRRSPRSAAALPQVADLALEEGPAPLELRHVSAAQGQDRRPRRRRQLRLVEGLELGLDLEHLLRDAVEAADIGRVQGGEEL